MINFSLSPIIEVKVMDPRVITWGLPKYQSTMAAAIDLYACLDQALSLPAMDPAHLISSGIAIHINNPHIAALIAPRSGLGHKKGLVLGNSIGVIDADYSGTVYISIWNRNSSENIIIEPGDRIAQMIFVPIVRPTLISVDQFSSLNQRGENGFGSTDLKEKKYLSPR